MEFRGEKREIFIGDSVVLHVKYSIELPWKTLCSMVIPWSISHGIPQSLCGKFHVFPLTFHMLYKTGTAILQIAAVSNSIYVYLCLAIGYWQRSFSRSR